MCVCIPLKLSHSLFTMKIIFIYSHWPVPFFKKIDKILAPTQNVVHICQKMAHAKYFFCSAKIVTSQGLQKTPNSPIGAKNSLQRKYGSMVLPEKVLRSRTRNKSPFQNTILLD